MKIHIKINLFTMTIKGFQHEFYMRIGRFFLKYNGHEQGDININNGNNFTNVNIINDNFVNANAIDANNTHIVIDINNNQVDISDVNVEIIDENGMTPLFCKNNTVEMAKIFIDKGADVNHVDNLGMTPLLYAINDLHIDMIELLLNNNANINQITTNMFGDNRTPIKYALKFCKNMDVIQLLLNFNSIMDEEDKELYERFSNEKPC